MQIYWSGDRYHWRTTWSHDAATGFSAVDPQGPSFGSGLYYFEAPGGAEMKYSDSYEVEGLTFSWDPTKEQQELIVKDPASSCCTM